jgi:hypothetical protein
MLSVIARKEGSRAGRSVVERDYHARPACTYRYEAERAIKRWTPYGPVPVKLKVMEVVSALAGVRGLQPARPPA